MGQLAAHKFLQKRRKIITHVEKNLSDFPNFSQKPPLISNFYQKYLPIPGPLAGNYIGHDEL